LQPLGGLDCFHPSSAHVLIIENFWSSATSTSAFRQCTVHRIENSVSGKLATETFPQFRDDELLSSAVDLVLPIEQCQTSLAAFKVCLFAESQIVRDRYSGFPDQASLFLVRLLW
jgi:hypothetical protein